ncbi:type II toxin-antitoxin system VapC family toxin [Lyngbya sp. CCY1209]|uniref:type II toxin-antitoxin system VapC family toxin n=1 Tax=Lyngbya sp. CCY1209 TaxID=2886103 RepID=UPI002D21577C|nr:type II toxin-antitoxin system VapC family toxin [Lyngbya sp. CCY1209]MEB3881893.1 type II toxin-antitoxin system VapC family toxin [Lyngbya sp. CCY1209]
MGKRSPLNTTSPAIALNYPAAEAKASLLRLKGLALKRMAIPELVSEALDIAIAQAISAYDACYIALSERLKIPFVTADSKLIRSLEGTAYQIHSLMSFDEWIGF